MEDDLVLRKQDLVDDPMALCLVLNVSGSMNGRPIAELNRGVRLFFESVLADEIARYAAEIAVVTFGNGVTRQLDFGSIQRQEIPEFTAYGDTPMGGAVDLALTLLDGRKQEYKDSGADYYQPWMVLMTDGSPTDDISSSAARTAAMVRDKKLTIFPIAIGDQANLTTLAAFSPARPPARLNGLNFPAFFEWLSKSVSRTSQSTPGERVDLPSVDSWATL